MDRCPHSVSFDILIDIGRVVVESIVHLSCGPGLKGPRCQFIDHQVCTAKPGKFLHGGVDIVRPDGLFAAPQESIATGELGESGS